MSQIHVSAVIHVVKCCTRPNPASRISCWLPAGGSLSEPAISASVCMRPGAQRNARTSFAGIPSNNPLSDEGTPLTRARTIAASSASGRRSATSMQIAPEPSMRSHTRSDRLAPQHTVTVGTAGCVVANVLEQTHATVAGCAGSPSRWVGTSRNGIPIPRSAVLSGRVAHPSMTETAMFHREYDEAGRIDFPFGHGSWAH